MRAFLLLCLVAPTGCGISDLDEDGYATPEDCDDADPDLNPDARELCDGIDNNCNGVIDEGAMTTYFRDADGDWFGDPATRMESCTPQPGWVTNTDDCNDADPAISPDAHEVCNRIDDDCDPDTNESGTASFVTATELIDVTAALSEDAEGPLVLDQDGTLDLCGGVYRARIEVRNAQVDVVGRSDTTTRFAALEDQAAVLHIDGGQVHLEHVDLFNGGGVRGEDARYGGAAACHGAGATLSMEHGSISGSDAPFGSAVAAWDGCVLSLTDVEVREGGLANHGGVVYLSGGSSTHTLKRTRLTENPTTPLLVTGGADVLLDAVIFNDNNGIDGVGAMEIRDGSVTWRGDAGPSSATDNLGEDGAIVIGNGWLDVEDVRFGTAARRDQNEGPEVHLVGPDRSYGVTDRATFTCSPDACGTPVELELGSRERRVEFINSGTVVTYVRVTRSTTVEQVWARASMPESSCTGSLFVARSLDAEPDERTRLDILQSAEVAYTERLGDQSAAFDVPLHPGRTYAIGLEWTCTSGGVIEVERGESASLDLGFGTIVENGSWHRLGSDVHGPDPAWRFKIVTRTL